MAERSYHKSRVKNREEDDMHRIKTAIFDRAVIPAICLAMLLSVAGVSPAAVSAGEEYVSCVPSVVGDVPETAFPGTSFEVTITFTALECGFNSTGLTDSAPAGWTVNVDQAWCTPQADMVNANGNAAEIIWFGPYDAGTEFTSTYEVQVPADVEPGVYNFVERQILFRVEACGPYTFEIAGNSQVEIPSDFIISGLVCSVDGNILSGVTVTVYKDGEEVASVVVDGEAEFHLSAPPDQGIYTLTASKECYQDRIINVEVVAYTGPIIVLFTGDNSLIPLEVEMPYVLTCVNHWLYPPQGNNGLQMETVLQVINCWLYTA